jgi:hypothetical protein
MVGAFNDAWNSYKNRSNQRFKCIWGSVIFTPAEGISAYLNLWMVLLVEL